MNENKIISCKMVLLIRLEVPEHRRLRDGLRDDVDDQ
jgi:hypothetical protein